MNYSHALWIVRFTSKCIIKKFCYIFGYLTTAISFGHVEPPDQINAYSVAECSQGSFAFDAHVSLH